MSLPKQLLKSYSTISNCDLVVNNKVNPESIEEFVVELNKAIPTKTNILAFTIYKFNRNKYLSDKVRFINDIIGFPYYEHMILWCDYNDILKYFKLEDKIFLGWDRYNNCYKAYESKKNMGIDTPIEPVNYAKPDVFKKFQENPLFVNGFNKELTDTKPDVKSLDFKTPVNIDDFIGTLYNVNPDTTPDVKPININDNTKPDLLKAYESQANKKTDEVKSKIDNSMYCFEDTEQKLYEYMKQKRQELYANPDLQVKRLEDVVPFLNTLS